MASRCDGQSEELDQRLAGDMNTGHKPVFFLRTRADPPGMLMPPWLRAIATLALRSLWAVVI